MLTPTTAEVVARYTREYYAGRPAITLNHAGAGRVLYAGTLAGSELFTRLARWLLELASIEPLLETPHGVEATARWKNGRRLLFLLNHNESSATVTLDHDYRNLLREGAVVSGNVSLAPYEVMILQ